MYGQNPVHTVRRNTDNKLFIARADEASDNFTLTDAADREVTLKVTAVELQTDYTPAGGEAVGQ